MTKTEICEDINRHLLNRTEWEKKLSRLELQRFTLDRSAVNNNPWPRASNIRYPLSDMIIGQKLPYLYKVIYSTDQLATFAGMPQQSAAFNTQCAGYFDWVVKELTNFNGQIQFAANSGLQDGEALMKILWDSENQVPLFYQIDNLFLITPSDTTELEDAPWLVHILQMSEDQVLKRFKDVPGIKEFVAKVKKAAETTENDVADRMEARYNRQGINRSYQDGTIVLWERHYIDEQGKRRWMIMSPDDPEFDFKEDKEYLCDLSKCGKWSIVHYRREYLDKSMHSSRGVPERVQEGEHALSAMWRAKHNAMTLFNAPWLSTESPLPQGSTQNFNMLPGQIFPIKVSRVDLGSPPISWDEEMRNMREVFERREATPDFGIGTANEKNDSRTKFEVQQIGNLQGLSADLETGNWKAFVRKIFRQAWALMVANLKRDGNKSLKFFLNNEGSDIPIEAITDDYVINVAGSAEAVNKQANLQNASAIWEQAKGNPYANALECWKNLLEYAAPGQVDRFTIDPQQRQAQAKNKAAADISIMLSTGFQILPEPTDDLYTQAVMAMQFLQKAQARNESLTADQFKRISDYIAANREALRQTNKDKYAELNQALDQLDQAAAQQMMQGAQQAQMQQGLPPQLPAPTQAMPAQPAQPLSV